MFAFKVIIKSKYRVFCYIVVDQINNAYLSLESVQSDIFLAKSFYTLFFYSFISFSFIQTKQTKVKKSNNYQL